MKKGGKKQAPKKSGHKIALSVISSIILIILIVSIVNVGLSIFFESPSYSDFCGTKDVGASIRTEAECGAAGGEWTPYEKVIDTEHAIEGYCDTHAECRDDWEEAQKSFNQMRYYVFAIFGLILFFVGAYATMPTIQYTGLGSGAILLLEGIVTNLQNKVMVFVSLIVIFIIFGFLVFKKLEKK